MTKLVTNSSQVVAHLVDIFGWLCPIAHGDVDATAFGDRNGMCCAGLGASLKTP